MAPAKHAAPEIFLPDTTAALLSQHAIEDVHVHMLLSDGNVRRSLYYFDQVRRDLSANPSADIVGALQRVSMAQQMLVSWIHHAWEGYAMQQTQLENPQLQLILIDGMLCTQP